MKSNKPTSNSVNEYKIELAASRQNLTLLNSPVSTVIRFFQCIWVNIIAAVQKAVAEKMVWLVLLISITGTS